MPKMGRKHQWTFTGTYGGHDSKGNPRTECSYRCERCGATAVGVNGGTRMLSVHCGFSYCLGRDWKQAKKERDERRWNKSETKRRYEETLERQTKQ